MSPVRRKIQRLLVLFIFGVLAINYPLLSLFNKVSLWFGIPQLYVYLFGFWAIFILLIGIVTERKKLPKTSFPPISRREGE